MRRLSFPFPRCCPLVAVCAAWLGLSHPSVQADNTVALGDSLTAEYDTIPDIPGFDQEATAYAEVSDAHPDWVSRSWVEVMGKLRGYFFDFGEWRSSKTGWLPPRLSGYEFNWGVPGAKASQYEDFMTSSFNSSPLYFGFRIPLDKQLRSSADRVVIWLGTNDLREKYGSIYDASDSTARNKIIKELGDGLIDDLKLIIQHVQGQNSKLEIVIGNLPDIGVAPKVQADHTDPDQRDLVTAGIEAINARIVTLAADQKVAVADIYTVTKQLIADEPFFFGAVQFTNGYDPDADNEPHYLFTRDGFHPNTALQIQIARTFLRAFNTNYDAGVPQITDAEALKLLKINPREPYFQWRDSHPFPEGQGGLLKDPDLDGMTNLMEYAFDTDPLVSNASNLPFSYGGPVPGIISTESVTYFPAPEERRDIDIAVQYKFGDKWIRVPAERIVPTEDGTGFTAAIPLTPTPAPLRIKVSLLPPKGSLNTLATVFRIQRP